jgi:signal transduction histidine kinase
MHHILGFAQLLDMDLHDSEQRSSVTQILLSGAHLMTLIDRILQVSQSEPNNLSFLETSTTPSSAVSEARGQ